MKESGGGERPGTARNLEFPAAITSSVETTVGILMDASTEVNNNNKGGKVRLEVKGPEEWLCVSRLPPDISEDEFYDILSEFGGVEESFLVNTQSGNKVFVIFLLFFLKTKRSLLRNFIPL